MEEKESKDILSRIQTMERELSFLKERVLSQTNTQSPKNQTPPVSKPTPVLNHQTEVTLDEGPNWFVQWIGENLFVKLGVFSLLVATIWFFYLAIEEYWINESVRIWIGLISAIPILIYGFRVRHSRPYLSPSLLGLGIAVLFSAYYSGYLWYDLYSTETCFVGLLILSLTTVAISHAQKSEVLFGFASLGAFSVPLLLSTGQNSYPFLFTYLLLWNLLFFWVRKDKDWKVIPLLLLAANHLIFVGWASDHLTDAKPFFPITFQLGVFILFLLREFQTLESAKSKDQILTLVTIAFTVGLGFVQSFWAFSIFYPIAKPFLLSLILILFYGLYERSLRRTKLNLEKKKLYDLIGLFGLPFIVSLIVIGTTGKFLAFSLISFAFLVTVASTYSKQLYMYFAAFPVWFFALFYIFAFTYRSQNEIPFLNGRFLVFATGSVYLVLSYLYSRKFSDLSKLFLYAAYPYWLLGTFVEIYLGYPEEKQLFLYTVSLIVYGLVALTVGFGKKIQTLRYVGFGSLTLVIIKFYLYDFWNLSLGYRILAGLFLGITLIVTGTFYNHFKKETK
ncbi:DUF2339 domain-containing protein [Leptospira montravelensis]|uniref:DUF2339 domain-containing protein n=1 Tax=Leptospira montravelensis TaxID=2484961 RepID=A0ABY2LVB0_9LEPT|nr:DUF2339 domain-containing protein [Leptospira montravelensis]TGK84145.1 DUF2339 domain-containing protein [Leptospira montravelensis]TGL06154.1 DUF2339 domain-containing protein [Leptospira montravelensis]